MMETETIVSGVVDKLLSNEAQRKTWSVFSDKEFVSEHSLQLEKASKDLGKVCQIQSMCVFSSNPRAGQQVAVVLDILSDFTNERIRTRIAERCPEAFLAIVQPCKAPSAVPPSTPSAASSRQTPAATVHLLSPGGPVVRSMCLTMAMAACAAVAGATGGPAAAAFPAVVPDGRTVTMRAEGGGWREDVRVRLDGDGALWAALPAPRLLGLVPAVEVCDLFRGCAEEVGRAGRARCLRGCATAAARDRRERSERPRRRRRRRRRRQRGKKNLERRLREKGEREQGMQIL